MSIDKIKKAYVFVHDEDYLDFVFGLKQLSIVELVNIEYKKPSFYFNNFSQEEIRENLSRLEFGMGIFKKYLSIKEMYLTKREYLSLNKKEVIDFSNYVYKHLEEIDKKIKIFETELEHLESKINVLKKFELFDADINLLKKIKNINYFFSELDFKKYEKFKEKVYKFKYLTIPWEEKNKLTVSFFCLYHNIINEELNKYLLENNVEIYNFLKDCSKNSLLDEIVETKEKINIINSELKNLKLEVEKFYEKNRNRFLSCYKDLLELNDYILAQNNFGTTSRIKIISFWVPEIYLSKLIEYINKYSSIYYLFIDPLPQDDVPIVLKNKPIVQPYEFVTTLYSYPKKDNLDPTVFLAPFFTLFFALCMSDVVYGIFLFFVWFFLKNKIKTFGKLEQLFVLFKYLGIITIFAGVITDSFIGFNVLKNFGFTKRIILFDPLKKPIDFLKFSFLLGLIQITFGMMIKFFRSVKLKDFWGMIEMLLWKILLISLVPAVYQLIFAQRVNQVIYSITLKVALVTGIVMIIILGRETKNIFLKPFSALFKLYSIVGYYSDIFSYARILALSLAGTAISQTINLLSNTTWNIKFFGPILSILIFIAGHMFNFTVNCLGAFVHSARLQYLEFFSKFFEGGGRPIKYFSPIKQFVK